jgi:hypothetical protein
MQISSSLFANTSTTVAKGLIELSSSLPEVAVIDVVARELLHLLLVLASLQLHLHGATDSIPIRNLEIQVQVQLGSLIH